MSLQPTVLISALRAIQALVCGRNKMIGTHWLFAGAFFGACLGATAQVPMEKEPRHHVVFETKHSGTIRVGR